MVALHTTGSCFGGATVIPIVLRSTVRVCAVRRILTLCLPALAYLHAAAAHAETERIPSPTQERLLAEQVATEAAIDELESALTACTCSATFATDSLELQDLPFGFDTSFDDAAMAGERAECSCHEYRTKLRTIFKLEVVMVGGKPLSRPQGYQGPKTRDYLVEPDPLTKKWTDCNDPTGQSYYTYITSWIADFAKRQTGTTISILEKTRTGMYTVRYKVTAVDTRILGIDICDVIMCGGTDENSCRPLEL